MRLATFNEVDRQTHCQRARNFGGGAETRTPDTVDMRRGHGASNTTLCHDSAEED